MSWNDEEATAKPTTAATAATELPESGQVTAENFLSPQSARLNGSEFRSTTNSIDSKPDATLRDAQIRLRLDTARVLRKAVQKQFQARPKAAMKDWAGTGVQQRLQKKVAETESLLKQLNVRMEGTESITRKVNQALCNLEREQHALEEPAIICARRLCVRGQRPEEEQVEDDLQLALQNERSILEHAYNALGAYLDGGHELLEALQAAKGELVDDLLFKRHALRLEKSALQFDPFHGRDRACVLPLMPEKGPKKSDWIPSASTKSAGEEKPQRSVSEDERLRSQNLRTSEMGSVSPRDESQGEEQHKENVQRSAHHTSELIGRTQDLEKNAKRFIETAVSLLQSIKGKVKAASDGTNKSLRANMAKRLQQKKALEKGLAECREDIARTEGLLQHMQQEIEGQEASLDEWEAAPEISLDRLDQRLPLAVQQDIRQSAFERMQEQVHNAKSNVDVLSNHCEESKELLSQLRESHDELQEHLNAENASWRIDLQCAKLRSVKAAEAPLRSEASAKKASNVVPPPLRLSEQTLEEIRSKIKAAAYEGPRGQGFDMIFNRYDQAGSGCLNARDVRSALRRSFRIPESSISDRQIFSLCAWLDVDGSGRVDIDELVTFLGTGAQGSTQTSKSTTESSERRASKSSFRLDCFVTPRRSPQNSQKKSNGRAGNRLPALNQRMLDTLRSRIKAASYAGQLGCEVKALFSRFDRTGTGVLEEEQLRQVIRRAMRIPAGVISDEQISKLCSMLDKDNSGVIPIETLVEFVGQDTPQSARNLSSQDQDDHDSLSRSEGSVGCGFHNVTIGTEASAWPGVFRLVGYGEPNKLPGVFSLDGWPSKLQASWAYWEPKQAR